MVPGEQPPTEQQQDQPTGGGLQKMSAAVTYALKHQLLCGGEGELLQVSMCSLLRGSDMDCTHSKPCARKQSRICTTWDSWESMKFLLWAFYSGVVESVLTQNITCWCPGHWGTTVSDSGCRTLQQISSAVSPWQLHQEMQDQSNKAPR